MFKGELIFLIIVFVVDCCCNRHIFVYSNTYGFNRDFITWSLQII